MDGKGHRLLQHTSLSTSASAHLGREQIPTFRGGRNGTSHRITAANEPHGILILLKKKIHLVASDIAAVLLGDQSRAKITLTPINFEIYQKQQ